jgi:hypothetical protein
MTRTVPEHSALELADAAGPDGPPKSLFVQAKNGNPELHAFEPGVYEFRTARGKMSETNVKSGPPPAEVTGAWTLHFPPNWGAPPMLTLDKLISWTEHPDPGVRYFSGSVQYEKEINISAEMLASGRALYLDLGSVKNIAEVTLNGKDLGTWWKPPFTADISDAAKPGKNQLRIRITNLWVNRLIGDEQFPDDCEWNGKPIKAWPRWLLDGTPRPAGERRTFTTWKHYTKDSTPIESGLIGPVVLRTAERVNFDLRGD